MNKLQKVAIDGSWEYWLRDGFPANDNGKVHRSKDLLPWSVNERLTSITDSVNEIVDCFRSNLSLAAVESSGDWSVEIKRFIAKPRTPVELFDAVVSAFHHFPNGCISGLGMVGEDK